MSSLPQCMSISLSIFFQVESILLLLIKPYWVLSKSHSFSLVYWREKTRARASEQRKEAGEEEGREIAENI